MVLLYYTLFVSLLSLLMSVGGIAIGELLAGEHMAVMENLAEDDVGPYLLANIGELASFGIIALFLFFVYWSINMILTGALVDYFYKALKKKKNTFSKSLDLAKSKALELILSGVLFVIFIVPLFILFVIPGIIATIFWILYVEAIVIRNKSYIGAFAYSFELVKNNWWRTFGYGFIVILLITVATSVIGVAFIPVYVLDIYNSNLYMTAVIDSFAGIFYTIIAMFAVIFKVIYYYGLEKEKGIDKN